MNSIKHDKAKAKKQEKIASLKKTNEEALPTNIADLRKMIKKLQPKSLPKNKGKLGKRSSSRAHNSKKPKKVPFQTVTSKKVNPKKGKNTNKTFSSKKVKVNVHNDLLTIGHNTIRKLKSSNKTIYDSIKFLIYLNVKLPTTKNSSIHNLSSTKILENIPHLLQGTKFIPFQNDLNFNIDIDPQLNSLHHKMQWTKFFQDRPSNFNRDYNPKYRYSRDTKYYDDNLRKDESISKLISVIHKDIETTLETIPSKPTSTKNIYFLKSLKQKYPAIIIKLSDKNLGFTILDTTQYNQLVMNHLNDIITYKKLSVKDIEMLPTIISDIIHNMNIYFRFINLTPQQKKWIKSKTDNPKIPKFHILPKIHKNPILGRPIVGAVNWVTTPYSILLDDLLQPIGKKLKYTIDDIHSLIKDITLIDYQKDDMLCTMDVASLYTNISVDRLIKKVHNINPYYGDITEKIITNNYFSYNNTIYHQKDGIAMGTNAAVSLANLYLDELDHCINKDPKIVYYRRFIDDIFLIYRDSVKELQTQHTTWNNIIPKINLELKSSHNTIDFLDITIFVHEGKLQYCTFQKSINNYMYLPSFSCHPLSTIRGFLKGEFTRYKRTNSNNTNFDLMISKFTSRLLERGYTKHFITQTYKDWANKIITDSTLSKITTNPTYLNLILPYTGTKRSKIVKDIIKKYEFEHILAPEYKIRLVWSTQKSITNLVTSSSLSIEQSKYLLKYTDHF